MRVNDGDKRSVIAGVQRQAGGLSRPQFFADSFKDQNIRVHRNADGQEHARDAGQGQRRPEGRQHRQNQDDIDDKSDIGDGAAEPIINNHE